MDDRLALQMRLRKQADKELAQRIALHKTNISRLRAAYAGAQNLGATTVNRPLVLLAQGDSWFDYPLNGNIPAPGGSDIIAHLRRLGSMPPTILNLSLHGSTSISEMSLRRQSAMIEQLRDSGNWINGKPDAILFSAGGNDIAGEEFCIVLDFNDGRANGLSSERYEGVLESVRACYLDLFKVRDRIAPGVPVFGHCYDFAIPDGSHPICAGPWLKPSLDYCNWSVAEGTDIVRKALVLFRAMLKTLEAQQENNFYVVETQGTLDRSDWANELHPKPDGFSALARKFAEVLDDKVRPTFGPNFALSFDKPSI